MKNHFLLLLLLIACAPKKEAGVSQITDKGKALLPMEMHSLTGQREGYAANAELVYINTESKDTLVIRLEMEPGVPTKFIRGEYKWKAFTGEVTCSSIDFFGGQGGVPSIGGNFEFSTSDGDKYFVFLPTTEMKKQIQYSN